MYSFRELLSGAAWFIDAEGYIGVHVPKRSQKPRVTIGISQKDRWVLDRFRAVVKCGGVYGPYGTTNKSPLFYYQLQGFERVQAVVAMLWEFSRANQTRTGSARAA